MAKTTLTGCLALLGPTARLSDGPVDILIDDTRIAAVRPAGAAPPEGEVIAARARLAAPGLINGHVHSHEHFHKGRYDNLPLELWMNYVRPLQPIPLTSRQVYLRTLIGAIEALRSGTTTMCDDMNVSPVLHREHVEAAFQAYEDIGIRAYLGITLFDKPFFCSVPFIDEEFPPELLSRLTPRDATTPEEILAFASHLAGTRHPRGRRVGYLAAPSAPQRCTPDFLLKVRELADEFDLPVIIHVQETRMQVVTGQLLLGSTMVEYLGRQGFLKPKTSLIHGIWLNPREIDLLARSGASVQHNPTSNMKMGSGIAPIRALLTAGVNVSLGSDGCGSIETTSMLRTVTNAALVQKLRPNMADWIGAEEAWRAGTMGGAHALGRADELGAIEVGRLADIVLYRLDTVSFTPLSNPLRQLVYAGDSAALDSVFVDGRCVVRDGKLLCIDEAAILTEIREVHAELAPLIAAAERQVEQLAPPYRRILKRCQSLSIAPDTRPAHIGAEMTGVEALSR